MASQQSKDDRLCLQGASEDKNLSLWGDGCVSSCTHVPQVLSLFPQMMRCVQTKPSLISSWSAPLSGSPLQPPFHYLSHSLMPSTNIDIITDLSSCLNLEATCPPPSPSLATMWQLSRIISSFPRGVRPDFTTSKGSLLIKLSPGPALGLWKPGVRLVGHLALRGSPLSSWMVAEQDTMAIRDYLLWKWQVLRQS